MSKLGCFRFFKYKLVVALMILCLVCSNFLLVSGTTVPPTYSSVSASTTNAGDTCDFSATFSDDAGLVGNGTVISGTYGNTGTATTSANVNNYLRGHIYKHTGGCGEAKNVTVNLQGQAGGYTGNVTAALYYADTLKLIAQTDTLTLSEVGTGWKDYVLNFSSPYPSLITGTSYYTVIAASNDSSSALFVGRTSTGALENQYASAARTFTSAFPTELSGLTYSQYIGHLYVGYDSTVGQYHFGLNNSGVWVWQKNNFTSNPQTIVYSATLNNTVGTVVSYQWWISDAAGNTNFTSVQNLTTTGAYIPYSMSASTELIGWSSFTTANIDSWLALVQAQNMSEFTLRFDAFTDWSDGVLSSTYRTKALQIIQAAYALGIYVNVDLHTWYTTWDSNFDDSATGYASKRVTYLAYVNDSVTKLDVDGVKAFMVLNEPQAQTASAGENTFILDCISTAKNITSKPVSVRFMAGYSPSTGHYSSAIDNATDFLARNTYWDPRSPDTAVYGTTEAKMNTLIDTATSLDKELWITEFGKTKTNTETQRAYVAGFVAYATEQGIDRIFCWVSQPVGGSSETYNIFNGWTPYPAWYELDSVGSTDPGYTFTVDVESGVGGVTVPDGEYTVGKDGNFSISAIANTGYIFSHWTSTSLGNFTANPLALTSNETLDGETFTAIFTYVTGDMLGFIPPAGYTYGVGVNATGYYIASSLGIYDFDATNASRLINSALATGESTYLYDGTYSDNSTAIQLVFTSGSLLIGESYNTIIVTNTISGSGTIGRLTLKGS